MFSQGYPSIDYKEFMSTHNELDIALYYLNISHIPIIINSPFREDKHPSFAIFLDLNNRVHFKDFATNESGNLVTLLSKLWHKTPREVLYIICTNHSLPKVNFTHSSKGHKSIKSNVLLQCKVRDWQSHDLKYWETYGISLSWLKFGDIYPISHIIYTKNSQQYSFIAEKYAYAYVERKDNKVSLKIYQPYSTKFKWRNNHDSSVWDLWTKLPESGDNLIITSSRKDALCIWANTGIPSVSLQAESYHPKESVINILKSRFKNIYILYDNDFQAKENHGRLLGKAIAERFGLKQIEIPDSYYSKDTSDLAKNHGTQCVKKVITQLIK